MILLLCFNIFNLSLFSLFAADNKSDRFEDWNKFSNEKNDIKTSRAIEYLKLKWPELLSKVHYRHLFRVKLAPKTSKGNKPKDPNINTQYQREQLRKRRNREEVPLNDTDADQLIKTLRIGDFLSDKRGCKHYLYLCKLPVSDQYEMAECASFASLRSSATDFIKWVNTVAVKRALQEKLEIASPEAYEDQLQEQENCYSCYVQQYKFQEKMTKALKDKVLKKANLCGALESIKEIDLVTWEIPNNSNSSINDISDLGPDRNNETNKKTDINDKFRIRKHFDPGYGDDSFIHYKTTPKGDIYCTHHGFFKLPKGCTENSTIRDQLKAYGITDLELLDECADIPPVQALPD